MLLRVIVSCRLLEGHDGHRTTNGSQSHRLCAHSHLSLDIRRESLTVTRAWPELKCYNHYEFRAKEKLCQVADCEVELENRRMGLAVHVRGDFILLQCDFRASLDDLHTLIRLS